jgi:hypothetical protein
MTPLDKRASFHVEITTKGCDLPKDELARIQKSLAPVAAAAEAFPTARLWVKLIYHPNSRVYHAEAKLKLPGRTIFSGGHDPYLDSACQTCVRQLLQRLEDYQRNPNQDAVERARRLQALGNNIVMPRDPDAGPIAAAVNNGEYRAFRNALVSYEDWLRNRVGRWLQRYPEAEERIGDGLLIGDLVEEVYLQAFEQYARRPKDTRMSEWLDRLVDAATTEFLRNPDEVREEASLARTVRQG